MNGKRPFVIDCDTGTDDAIAIMTALYCNDVDIKAITSVNGNVPVKWTGKNNLDLIEYLGFSIPVAKGASAPLVDRGNYYDDTHGDTGLGTVKVPEAQNSEFCQKDAASFIYEIAQREGGELELLVIGPMTNIAIALLNYPELKQLIKHIWFMGGAIRGGNVTTTAEFNIWVDPTAARIVMKSGIPLTMVGLDVTEKAVLNKNDSAEIRAIGSKAAVLASDILEYMFTRWKRGGEDAMMHDALAFCAAVAPECLTVKPYYVDVECSGEYTAGHTVVDVKGKLKREANVDVAVEVDLMKFKDWLKGCLKNSAE